MSTAGRVIGVVASGSSVRGTHRVSRVAPGPRRRVRNAAQFIDYRRKPFTGKPTATASPSSSSEDEGYLTLLADKTEKVRTLFGEGGFIPASGVEVYASPKTRGYRSRCRFAIARDDSGALRYALFENGEVVMLGDDDDGEEDEDVFPWASEPIARAMPVLLELLNASDETNGVASKGLSAVGFLASRGGEVVVTLWNTLNRQGDEDANGVPDATWNDDANALLSRLRDVNVVGVVTRRRGKTLTASDGVNHVWEPMVVPGDVPGDLSPVNDSTDAAGVVGTGDESAPPSRHLRYKQVEGAFSNPNGDVAEVTARWLHSVCDDIRATRGGADEPLHKLPWLLELYCGNGNHTVSLAPKFGRVTAVEIEPRLVSAANENFAVNGVANARVQALPAEVFARTRNGTGGSSLLDGDEVDVLLADAWRDGVVLVDPPRAGLDADTLELVAGFRTVLYIACDGASLARDLASTLGRTHEVRRMALFDHFPSSRFYEVVVWLEAKA